MAISAQAVPELKLVLLGSFPAEDRIERPQELEFERALVPWEAMGRKLLLSEAGPTAALPADSSVRSVVEVIAVAQTLEACQ